MGIQPRVKSLRPSYTGLDIYGDTTPCKVTPVILRGVGDTTPCRMTEVTLHGVVFPDPRRFKGSGIDFPDIGDGPLQGFLAHKKHTPRGSLHWPYA